MFCSKCGQPTNGAKYCANCGNVLNQPVQQPVVQQAYYQQPVYMYQNNNYVQPKSKTNQVVIGICISCAIIVITFVYLIISSNGESVYFSDGNNVNGGNDIVDPAPIGVSQPNNGVTSIDYGTSYQLSVPTTESAVIDAIKEDSESQKENCSPEIIEIENRIINNYQITAVNLCEMSVEGAKGVESAVAFIYNEYPSARGYLVHLSLGNINQDSTLAFFQWCVQFTSSTQDELWGIKVRIILNSLFYLNEAKTEQTVKYSSATGHFPKNATTYSPIVHELGHYLSYIATANYYGADLSVVINPYVSSAQVQAINDFSAGTHSKRMCEEAYNNYKLKRVRP